MDERKKKIEEMAEDIYQLSPCPVCDYDDAKLLAGRMYKEGYRKQREGEWKKTCVPDVFQCTNCKRPTKMDELCDSEILREYCPNCGAKMKKRSKA